MDNKTVMELAEKVDAIRENKKEEEYTIEDYKTITAYYKAQSELHYQWWSRERDERTSIKNALFDKYDPKEPLRVYVVSSQTKNILYLVAEEDNTVFIQNRADKWFYLDADVEDFAKALRKIKSLLKSGKAYLICK